MHPITVRSAPPEGWRAIVCRSHLDPVTQQWIDRHPIADLKPSGSSLKFCVIAKGEAELYPRLAPTMEWDTAAGHAVLLAAETAISSRGEPPWDLYNQRTDQLSSQTLTRPQARTLPRHLRRLEAESIEIMRDVVFEFEKPVMLYSIGKDSSVMLHLAIKAFYPAPLPFPLLRVDTTWKFREMIAFRDATAKRLGVNLIAARLKADFCQNESNVRVNRCQVAGARSCLPSAARPRHPPRTAARFG
jgi:hypothetical protein